jgi:hypothetical protein
MLLDEHTISLVLKKVKNSCSPVRKAVIPSHLKLLPSFPLTSTFYKPGVGGNRNAFLMLMMVNYARK